MSPFVALAALRDAGGGGARGVAGVKRRVSVQMLARLNASVGSRYTLPARTVMHPPSPKKHFSSRRAGGLARGSQEGSRGGSCGAVAVEAVEVHPGGHVAAQPGVVAHRHVSKICHEGQLGGKGARQLIVVHSHASQAGKESNLRGDSPSEEGAAQVQLSAAADVRGAGLVRLLLLHPARQAGNGRAHQHQPHSQHLHHPFFAHFLGLGTG
mmetsp:Transcript_49031/g.93730  ORF Transcript_49031/g.93730 Transcript_49031/m.93730 type:complete len:211 (+) Transcript_49031:478-1110(+)